MCGHQSTRLTSQVFPQTPQDSLHLPSPHWWHGLLLGQVDCAGSVSRLRVVWAGNSGIQATYHYVGLKLGHRLWVCMPLALLSLLTVKDYGCRGIRADPLNMVPKLVASLLGVYRCPAQTFMGLFLYDRVFQTSGERWEHSTSIIGIIYNLYRKK